MIRHSVNISIRLPAHDLVNTHRKKTCLTELLYKWCGLLRCVLSAVQFSEPLVQINDGYPRMILNDKTISAATRNKDTIHGMVKFDSFLKNHEGVSCDASLWRSQAPC